MDEKKFWLVQHERNSDKVKVLCGKIIFRAGIRSPFFRPDDSEYLLGFCPDHVFETEEAANAFAEKLFERKQELGNSYLKDSMLADDSAFAKLVEMKKYIDSELSAFAGYIPVNFCDVSAGGIQIRGTNQSTDGYFMVQTTVPYSFCGYMEKAEEFVKNYKEYYGNADTVNEAKKFIWFGEKYGWD